MSYGEAFGLTLAVEVPLYVAGLVVLRLARPGRALLAGVLANVVTHPVLWWVLSHDVGPAAVVGAELGVWLVEAAVLRVVVRRDVLLALLLALGANAASFGVGLVLSAVGG